MREGTALPGLQAKCRLLLDLGDDFGNSAISDARRLAEMSLGNLFLDLHAMLWLSFNKGEYKFIPGTWLVKQLRKLICSDLNSFVNRTPHAPFAGLHQRRHQTVTQLGGLSDEEPPNIGASIFTYYAFFFGGRGSLS